MQKVVSRGPFPWSNFPFKFTSNFTCTPVSNTNLSQNTYLTPMFNGTIKCTPVSNTNLTVKTPI